VAEKSKKVAFIAALTYLGTCPEYYAHITDIPLVLAPKLALSLQKYFGDPSESEQACQAAVKVGLEACVNEYMEGRNEQEQIAVKWIALDQAQTICNKRLMESLHLFESIRRDYPRQYIEALHIKLLLDVVTEERIKPVLLDVCGGPQALRKNVRLYSLGHKPAQRAAHSSVAPIVGAISALLSASLLVAVISRRRAQHEHGRLATAPARRSGGQMQGGQTWRTSMEHGEHRVLWVDTEI